ncbi:hypothetical protein, partial [Paenibacillus ferrarius]|uniref:hypothetical protein n=1 Tax=Paenibacillus ferrarius TaxID=1469647 RepID=UPI003D2AF15F
LLYFTPFRQNSCEKAVFFLESAQKERSRQKLLQICRNLLESGEDREKFLLFCSFESRRGISLALELPSTTRHHLAFVFPVQDG